MSITLPGVPEIAVGDIETGGLDYTGILDSGETLTGTPTVTEVGTSDLTLGSKVVNSAAVTIKSRTVAIGMAVLFSVTGVVAGTTYNVKVQVDTSAGRRFVRYVRVIGA